MNGRFQKQGGNNWFLPKEMNANRFFWDSHWLKIWSNHFYPSMGPNGGSVAMDSGCCGQGQDFARGDAHFLADLPPPQIWIRIRIRIKILSWIRIRIKTMRIHSPGLSYLFTSHALFCCLLAPSQKKIYIQGGSDISGTLSKLHCCIKKIFFFILKPQTI
jgi:hypothetical protein